MGHADTRILIGTDSQWWDIFTQSDEFKDGANNPVDRWSKQILNGLADSAGATAHFPSDGPPYAPFIAWALATGRFWQSPTGMMVHDRAGLMISIRGALEFPAAFAADIARPSPCDSCVGKPCVAACPVDALSDTHAYDVPRCKAYLDTPGGDACMTGGCHVRRACPVSQAFGRPETQSAFHMQAFRR
jgi:hypothetical protein